MTISVLYNNNTLSLMSYFLKLCVSRGNTITNFIICDMTRLEIEPMIYHTQGEHANHYTTKCLQFVHILGNLADPATRSLCTCVCSFFFHNLSSGCEDVWWFFLISKIRMILYGILKYKPVMEWRRISGCSFSMFLC